MQVDAVHWYSLAGHAGIESYTAFDAALGSNIRLVQTVREI